ncbi:MAG: hypothetical protein WC291_08960, partial [Thermodesulfovibrionales bacterium]
MKGKLLTVFIFIFTLCSFLAVCESSEKILSFDSLIHVNEDSSLTVTETIEVRAEGAEIRR